ncbi:MAG: branched-chain amino acid ABC transporter ATP-binding protein/permease [Betaproteobacteria bacterium]|nr:branched-chain amino acid ABC transporter ATP-binding protein/permease [Betaproteobacteria bacterium]
MFANQALRPWWYLLVAVLLALLPWASPNPYYVNLAQEVAILAIAGIGLNILLGLSGQISLGQAGFFAVSAYGSALLSLRLGWPLAASVMLGVIMSGLAGLVVGSIALRARTHYLAMVTLAFGFIVGILAQRWTGFTGGSMGLVGVPPLNWGDPRSAARNFLWTAAALFLAVQITSDFVMQSRSGRVLRTISESESFAATVGINAAAWRVGAFVVSAMLAGLAGALFAHQSGYVSSDAFNLDRSLAMLIVVVVGGLGHRYGPVLGAVFLVAMNQAIADLYTYSNFIFGALLLAVMVFLPDGLSGLGALVRRKRPASLRRNEAGPGAPGVGDIVNLPLIAVARGEPLLQLQQVSKSYFGLAALSDVSMTVRAGTVHALIGPNGAGKSTLINTICGLYRADSGVIRLAEHDITQWPAHRRARLGLARTFQNLQLIGGLSVIENVMLGVPDRGGVVKAFVSWLCGRPFESEQRARARALLGFLGIEGFADVSPGDLSYGHRKLAELARALAGQPQLMLLDEPIAGINEEESRLIAAGIGRLREAGVTILLVEHDMPFVMSVADEITVLDYGQKIAFGAPDAVRANPVVVEAYLGVETA